MGEMSEFKTFQPRKTMGGLLVTNNLVTNILGTNNLVTNILVTNNLVTNNWVTLQFGNLTIC